MLASGCRSVNRGKQNLAIWAQALRRRKSFPICILTKHKHNFKPQRRFFFAIGIMSRRGPARRDRLRDASAAVLGRAYEAVGPLREAVRRALQEAKQSLVKIPAPPESHEAVLHSSPAPLQSGGAPL